jgi:hypothetical protein
MQRKINKQPKETAKHRASTLKVEEPTYTSRRRGLIHKEEEDFGDDITRKV